MTSFDFDLFVIGGGSGGVRAARMAAQRGARVAVAESGALGGTCVNVGCIPKKLYSYAAHYAEAFEEARGFGWNISAPTFDWSRLKANRAKEISRLNGVYLNLLTGAAAKVINGRAMLLDAHTVEVNGARHTAAHILVATGGYPVVPDIEGRELVVTSDDMFDLDPFPKRLVVVGGGYIACEFASIFHGLGAQVTQLVRAPQVLRGFDDEVRDFIAAEMRKAGVDLRTNAGVAAVRRSATGLQVQLKDGQILEADTVLYATGRAPNVAGLGLEAAGVAQGKDGAIVVDAHYQTSVPSIHALGDVTARVQLTPVALGEAMVLVDRLFGNGQRAMGYDYIPTAVFTHPNIGTVGFSETEAREKFGEVTVFRSDFKPLKHTLSGSSERTLMKLVVETASDRVVGLHMVGPDAGEIVQGFAVAMKAGATKAVFDSTIGIHPTAAEEFVTMRTPVGA
ncbi:MAG: glutathione-disulfide reductase [Burkholderiaceae bacterium]|uniref:glutathione-disulfide reductase n=1 Tax=Hydrogenophaga sp. TaxID=1904254 RepID=UPI002773ECCE|nr:glutathione-disulfide reductase [Hydrogenophaga sp.]MDP2065910.1 glutathione-disulfide reductase [Burkholderiaceae bacterium]MDZ4144020.1 glutathione-disulfide reductase [Burkholderiales bacterium]MDZ4398845.1 glutathione-disulfide reductase [Hydrogenophaga sp.]